MHDLWFTMEGDSTALVLFIMLAISICKHYAPILQDNDAVLCKSRGITQPTVCRSLGKLSSHRVSFARA